MPRTVVEERTGGTKWWTQIITDDQGVEWKVKDRDNVTLARSPKRYKTLEGATQSLSRFMKAMVR